MSPLPDYRQATPDFTSTASSSAGERWYQDPPTPEGESSNARFIWDSSLVHYDQQFTPEHHGFGLLQDQIHTGANALESGKGTRESAPHQLQENVGSEQFPYESASATGFGSLVNDDDPELDLTG
ncbi:hypothetical protein Slin15195_G082060 [Septoria linicola]|uniref:Uncharacterized protein n=1 Tax=Septoria linicola TaxID=215465 RepID=A0A9Q9ELW8_9PEZI|nr:hypothetical protein Slin15195_G082060 [Septoria linicola]